MEDNHYYDKHYSTSKKALTHTLIYELFIKKPKKPGEIPRGNFHCMRKPLNRVKGRNTQTIFSFGDSFAQGICKDENSGLVDLNYTELLGYHFNSQYYNFGVIAYSYSDIFRQMTLNLHRIRPNDIVLLAGTSPIRLNIPMYTFDKNGTTHGMPAGMITANQGKERVAKDIIEFYNKNLSLEDARNMSDALYRFFMYICLDHQQAFKNHWDWYIEGYIKFFKQHNIKFYYWSKTEWEVNASKYKCSCGHWNNEYHKVFAQKLIRLIKKKPKGGTFDSSII